MLNIAVFGTGRIGKVHIHNMMQHPDICIKGICDPFNPNVQEIANRAQSANMTEDEIFADESIDAVAITSITSSHHGLLKKAIVANKHILCEKPIDLNIENIYDVQQLADKHTGVKIAIGFQRRFDHTFAKIQHNIASGEYGQLEALTITSRDPSPPPIDYIKHSGGLIRDMMIHDLDMTLFLIGDDEMSTVFAQGSNLVDPAIKAAGDIDGAMVQMQTKKGVLININNSRRNVSGYDQRIEAHCQKALLCAENVPSDFMRIATEQAVAQALPMNFFLERYNQAYYNELSGFVRWLIANDASDVITFNEAVRSSELAEAVIQSLSAEQKIHL